MTTVQRVRHTGAATGAEVADDGAGERDDHRSDAGVAGGRWSTVPPGPRRPAAGRPTGFRETNLDALRERLRLLHVRVRSLAVPTLVAATIPIERPDPVRLFAAASAAGEERTLWLRASDGFALLGVGSAWAIEPGGASRFRDGAVAWTGIGGAALLDCPEGVRGCGPLLLGGFGFSPEPATSHTWLGFAGARLSVARLLVTVSPDGAWLTACAMANEEPDEAAADDALDLWQRLCASTSDPVVLTPATGLLRIALEAPPEPDWRASVARLAGAVGRGRLDKVVLARRIDLVAGEPIDVPAALRRLETGAPESTVFAFGRGTRTFMGATPERLVRTEDREFRTIALAGSARRGHDPEEDRRLGEALLASEKDREEHAIVVGMLEETLRPVSERLNIAPGPTVIAHRHVQHLATEVSGRLRDRAGILSLVERLHPTPAVGGSPRDLALQLLAEEEHIERGWYAGPIGWLDRDGDGEFAVALRSGVVEGRGASLFAGCGIVADSDPGREWEESLIKLRALASSLGAEAAEPTDSGPGVTGEGAGATSGRSATPSRGDPAGRRAR